MRTPLQGGLLPVDATAGALVEIACDESGFSGTNLLHVDMPVITHASVDLTVAEAVALLTELRSRSRFSPYELKSGQFLRGTGAEAAREWFLTALHGRAHVHVVDKEFFLATRIVDLLLAKPSYAAGTRLAQDDRAAALYQARTTAGPHWPALLGAFVDLVRPKRRFPDDVAIERFVQARDALADPVLATLTPKHIRAVVTRLRAEDRTIPPPLEPLLPALAETVLTWSAGERRVLVFHDEQSALTADRLTRLQRALADPAGVSPLAGLVMVDSRDDPRVQVADLLAGMARRSPEVAIERYARATLRPPTTPLDPLGEPVEEDARDGHREQGAHAARPRSR